jgi:histone arginine demethylase JMJD6
MSSKEKTWERRASEAKAKHRPKLKDWGRSKFAGGEKFEEFIRYCELNNDVCTTSRPRHHNPENLTHVDSIRAEDLSVQSFHDFYEGDGVPCIIRNIPTVESWKAVSNWNFSDLRSKYKHGLFKVGEDDEGYKVKMKLAHFIDYLRGNTDDSPLYIFDSNYDVSAINKYLLEDYKVPSYFQEDIFQYVGEDRRPPYRWFLMGPKRSGTCVHIDPLATSAWNTVMQGRKRWVVFPPAVGKQMAKGWLRNCILKGEDDEAANYFMDILPRIRSAFPEHAANILEFTQHPGDTVYVPGDWWHAVINLDDTIAITQNYCSGRNFDAVWRSTRKGRPKMSLRWLKCIRAAGDKPATADATQPPLKELAARALELNEMDGFVMYEKKKNKKRDADSVSDGDTDAESTATGQGAGIAALSLSGGDRKRRKDSDDSSACSSDGEAKKRRK